MPNGWDKNWIRLCGAIDGFRSKHHRWPTRVRVFEMTLNNIKEAVLTEESFRRLIERIELVPDEVPFIAEDGTGATYNYGLEGFPKVKLDISAEAWLGIRPDRPGPHWSDIRMVSDKDD